MKLSTLLAVFGALRDARVRYLVAGGLAVNAHGYQRLTHDVDVVVQLEAANVLAAFTALATLGFQPMVPVTAAEFADPEKRRGWVEQKGMQVLNLFSERYPGTTVDLFVTEPFDFDREYAAALRGELAPELEVRFVSIPTLIATKQVAGRPKDLDDIQHLQWILEEQHRDR